MTAVEALARVTAITMIVGAATAVIAPRAHADVALLSADEPLSGSDTAIILGGTFMPTRSTDYTQSAEN